MQLLHTVETWPNSNGVCTVSENNYLAYPSPAPASSQGAAAIPTTSPNRTGDVVVFDMNSLQPVNVISAHKSAISALAFDSSGRLLATSSDKGTIVRVFRVLHATKVYEFRRGTYGAKIYSMNFNLDSTLLVVSSATETVHVFSLKAAEGRRSLKSYVPSMVKQMLEPQRDFAFVKIPGVNKNSKSVAAFSADSSRVLVITAEGSLFQFALDGRGGEGELLQQYSLGST